MAANQPPLWRRAVDAVERGAAPQLESLVRTREFARAVGLLTRTRGSARTEIAAASARLWHLINLPAGSDVARLRSQLGALDREVRRLSLLLEREHADAGEDR